MVDSSSSLEFEFQPSLRSIIHLKPLEPLQPSQLHFYAIQANPSFDPSVTPEIWTDVPTHAQDLHQWHSIPFRPTLLDHPQLTIWRATILLPPPGSPPAEPPGVGGSPDHYSFTYRLIIAPASPDETEPRIRWLGSLGIDGQIHRIDHRSRASDEGPSSIRELIINSSDPQHPSVHPQHPSVHPQHPSVHPQHPSVHPQHPSVHPQHPSVHPQVQRLTLRPPLSSSSSSSDDGNTRYPFLPLDHPSISQARSIQGLAFERSNPTWFQPNPFLHPSKISSSFDTQLIILSDPSQRAQYPDPILIIIPISTRLGTSTIRKSSDQSHLVIHTRTNSSSADIQSAQLSIISGPLSNLKHLIKSHFNSSHEVLKPKRYDLNDPQSPLRNGLNGLGYCTWNSLGPDYTLNQVIRALKSFKSCGFLEAIDRVLLDDGWQDTRQRVLSDWGPRKSWLKPMEIQSDDRTHGSSDPIDHPSDLAGAINLIRNQSTPPIKLIGVWLTITGYWHGLDPDSNIMSQFNLQKWSIRLKPPQQSNTDHWMLPSQTSIRPFWDTYFKYLHSAGVDFVKIDNQAGLDQLVKCETDPSQDVNVYKATTIDTVHELATLYFGSEHHSNVFNSMAHTPLLWFRKDDEIESQLVIQEPRRANHSIHPSIHSTHPDLAKKIMRTSDDFFPDLSDPNGHRWHIFSNSFNALLGNSLGFTPDFDMTMTQHPFSDYHGALRAFSSAPIFITDRLGEHGLPTYQKLTSPLKQARGISTAAIQSTHPEAGCILSSCCLGQAAENIRSGETHWGLLKLGLPAPNAGGGLIGLWNVKQSPGLSKAVDIITARDIAEALLESPTDDSHSTERSNPSQNLLILSHSHDLRFRVIEDFDIDAEIDIPQISSRPILESVLASDSFEIWRICRLADLPGFKGSTIQIASLGLLNQFVGLCGVTIPTNISHPSQGTLDSSAQAPEKVNHRPNSEIKSQLSPPALTRHRPDGGDDTSSNDLANSVRSDHPTEVDQGRTAKLRKFIRSLIRQPIQTVVTGIRELLDCWSRFIWGTSKSLFSYLFASVSSASPCAHPSQNARSSRSAVQQPQPTKTLTPSSNGNDPDEHTPLLANQNQDEDESHADVAPTPSSSNPIMLEPDRLKYQTLFTDSRVGFLILITGQEGLGAQSEEGKKQQANEESGLIERFIEAIEIRLDDRVLDLHDANKHEREDRMVVRLQLVNRNHEIDFSAMEETNEAPKTPDGGHGRRSFLLVTLNLQEAAQDDSQRSGHHRIASSSSSLHTDSSQKDFWTISFLKKTSNKLGC